MLIKLFIYYYYDYYYDYYYYYDDDDDDVCMNADGMTGQNIQQM